MQSAAHRRHSLLTTAVLTLVALLSASCGGQSQSPPDEVGIQLSWIHEYSVAGFHAAEQNGHYAEENLEVHLIEGGFSDEGYIDPIPQVLDGSVEFGLIDGFELLLARAAGKPIVAIGAVYQRSPYGLISLRQNNIARPQDLVGHTVSVSEGVGATQLVGALLSSQDIDVSELDIVPRTTFGIDPLISGEVDVLAAWIINEGVAVQEAGSEPNFVLLSDYGIDMYQVVIFTTEEIVAEEPDMIERFLRATAQGWQDVVDDPDGVAEFTLLYNDSLDLQEQRNRLQASLPLINPAGSRPLMMQPEVWKTTQDILLEQGLLDEPLDLEAAYTLDFLERIYAD